MSLAIVTRPLIPFLRPVCLLAVFPLSRITEILLRETLGGGKGLEVVVRDRVGLVIPPLSDSSCLVVSIPADCRESQRRPAVCHLLSTCTEAAAASCPCLFSFAVKATHTQAITSADYRKKALRRITVTFFYTRLGTWNVPLLTDQQTGLTL